jgi:hypothetical protein
VGSFAILSDRMVNGAAEDQVQDLGTDRARRSRWSVKPRLSAVLVRSDRGWSLTTHLR